MYQFFIFSLTLVINFEAYTHEEKPFEIKCKIVSR